jgi:hypothetical protein
MSGREASGIGGWVARLFPGLGAAGTAARPAPRVADRTLAVSKPVATAQGVAMRSARERDHERMQRRIRRTRDAYARLRRARSALR